MDGTEGQGQVEPNPVAELAVETNPEDAQALFDAFGAPQVAEPEPAAIPQPRNEAGQFASSKPAIDPLWRNEAKNSFFTDSEIDGYTDENALRAAIAERKVQMANQWGQQAAQPAPYQAPPQQPVAPPAPPQMQPPAPQQLSPIEQFDLAIDEDRVDESVVAPVKELASHVNKITQTLAAENAQLRQQVAQMHGTVQQSAQQSRAAQAARDEQAWDDVVRGIPEVYEAVGVPSDARKNENSINNTNWTMLAPLILQESTRIQRELGAHRLMEPQVMAKITRDAFARSGLAKNVGATQPQPQSRPGQILTGTPGQPMPEHAAGEDTSHQDSVRAVTDAWDQAGGNPFSLGD